MKRSTREVIMAVSLRDELFGHHLGRRAIAPDAGAIDRITADPVFHKKSVIGTI